MEFSIGHGNRKSFAELKSDSIHNLPNQTNVQMKDGKLFYAGGNDDSFNCEKFEVYGIELWNYNLFVYKFI